MKNLDEKELKATNGGLLLWLLSGIAFSILWETVGDPDACGAAINQGAGGFLSKAR